MVIQQKLYTIDDLWAMESNPAFEGRYFYLIDGILFEDEMPGRTHGRLAANIIFELELFNRTHKLGEVTVETGYHPVDTRYTLLLPDIAFQRFESVPQPPPESYVPAMPDLAVEILSPNDTLAKARRKAQVYLENGTALVWLVQPKRKGVEVLRLVDDAGMQAEFLGTGDKLSGEEVLPSFELKVDLLFPLQGE